MFKAACAFSRGDKMVSRGISDKVEILTVTHSSYGSEETQDKVWIEFGNERRLFDYDARLEYVESE